MDLYYYTTLRDTEAAIYTPSPNSRKFRLGRIYTQMYPKSKVNFVTTTIITITEPVVESLGLDPEYVRSM